MSWRDALIIYVGLVKLNADLQSFFLSDCKYLRSVENGKVDISMGTTFTSMATYSCNTGYQLRGDSTRLCQATGNWSGDQPSCDVIGNV